MRATWTAPLALLPLLAACGGATAPAGPPQAVGAAPVAASPSPSASPVACPRRATAAWPATVPKDLPVPPTTKITTTSKDSRGVVLVRFATSTSLREGVLFVVRALGPAGYTLGRGDAEAVEADAPFAKDTLNGVMRMVAVAPCSTQWILALAHSDNGGSPLLPTRARPSPSPLPFG